MQPEVDHLNPGTQLRSAWRRGRPCTLQTRDPHGILQCAQTYSTHAKALRWLTAHLLRRAFELSRKTCAHVSHDKDLISSGRAVHVHVKICARVGVDAADGRLLTCVRLNMQVSSQVQSVNAWMQKLVAAVAGMHSLSVAVLDKMLKAAQGRTHWRASWCDKGRQCRTPLESGPGIIRTHPTRNSLKKLQRRPRPCLRIFANGQRHGAAGEERRVGTSVIRRSQQRMVAALHRPAGRAGASRLWSTLVNLSQPCSQ
jgi:hypothetical protein